MNKPDLIIKLSVYILAVLFCYAVPYGHVLSQNNLIPNGSFEELDSCPFYVDGVNYGYVNDWFNCIGSSDYYNECSVGIDASIPVNTMGSQDARTGKAYTGIILYYNDTMQFEPSLYREYISCQLIESLEAHKLYCLKMYVSLADGSYCTIDELSVLFSSDSSFNSIYSSSFFIDETPQLTSDIGFIDDKEQWVEIEWRYRALGTERFLTIGNFQRDDEVDRLFIPYDSLSWLNPIYLSTYIYIDDVSLVACEWENLPNVFSPNDDGINDLFELDYLPFNSSITIYNRWGIKVFESNMAESEFWNGTVNGRAASEGIYYYIIRQNDLKRSGSVHLFK